MRGITICLVFLLCLTIVLGDINLQCGRGSNNRHSGQGREVNNNLRLFNSQNNARSGYNVGNHFYYDGSILNLDWTAQHTCGNANNRCEFILQYMCDDKLRDGTTDSTIPDNAAADVDPRYGRHESWEYYQYCKNRSRIRGLYNSGQLNNENQNTARFTRQNAGGTRYGFECPEEENLYPYPGPTPWRDIAIITNEPQRCDAYKNESQNVKDRFYCHLDDVSLANGIIPITEEECIGYTDKNGVAGVWKRVPAWGIDPPACTQSQYTRDNHLGNTIGGQMTSYNWTIPKHFHERCVFRIRYNITSYDMEGFKSLDSIEPGWTSEQNQGLFDPKLYGFDNTDDMVQRGYQLTGNPDVDPFGSIITGANKIKLQHNVNTNQYFRTFQDRSHRFAIRSREGLYPPDAIIYNVNVRGKRGNVVQTYPANEYDFCPNLLDVTVGDYIHFQWTGSNANPGNNDGNGRAGSDISNIVQLRGKVFNDIIESPNSLRTYGEQSGNLPDKISYDSTKNFLGWDSASLLKLALHNHQQFGGDLAFLNDAGTYFNLEPKPVERVGIFNYISTRNNNFSNRSQKGRIKSDVSRSAAQLIGWGGGEINAEGKAIIRVSQGTFTAANNVALTVAPRYILSDYGVSTDNVASDVVYVTGPLTADGRFSGSVELTIVHTGSPISDTYIAFAPTIVKANENDTIMWQKISTRVKGGKAVASTNRAGVYVVRSKPKVGLIVAIALACAVFLALAIGLVIYCKKKANQDALRLANVEA